MTSSPTLDNTITPLPSNQKIVNADGTPTIFFQRWAQERSIDISNGITYAQLMQILASIEVIAGDGLTGGGPIDESVTLALDVIAGVAGSYTLPNIMIDSHGRVIAAADGGIEVSDGTNDYTEISKLLFSGATVSNPSLGEAEVTITGGGGGGQNYFDGESLPVPSVSDFILTADSSFSGTAAIQSAATGVSLKGQNGGFNFAWADKTIPSGGTSGDFAVTGLIRLGYTNNGNWGTGITLGDATGRRVTWGFRNTQLWSIHSSGTNGNDGFTTYGSAYEVMIPPMTYRIRKTGTTIYFELAFDGANFDTIASESATSYLASTVTTYGIGILPNGTFQRLICHGLKGA